MRNLPVAFTILTEKYFDVLLTLLQKYLHTCLH